MIRKRVSMVLAILLVGCFLQQTVKAVGPPVKITGKMTDTRAVSKIFQEIGPLVLDNDKQIAVGITSDGQPLVVVDGNVLENVSMDTADDNVLIVVGTQDEEANLSPVMTVELSRSVTGKLGIQISAADSPDVRRFRVAYTTDTDNNSTVRHVTVSAEVCNCVGGVNIPKRGCFPPECANPGTGCSTSPGQPDLAYCKTMEGATIPQPGDDLAPIRSESGKDRLIRHATPE